MKIGTMRFGGGCSILPPSGQLGIDRGMLDVFVSEPVFEGQVGSPFA
jgi:hypothetical protein